MMNRIWIVAAVPFFLMAAMLCGFWVRPSWGDTAEPLTCVLILAGALLTGLCVLGVIFAGWLRGAYQFKRGDILVATLFASLDVLVPTTLAVLLGLLLYSLKQHPITFF
jgi:mannose/fructose/N-acetylgalactosamine-specific phosphotransferase system component IID